MAVAWTEAQKQAIELSGCNLLVSAAAGSGKTAVLVERIIRKIEAGTDIDRLLVTTFTNAAAAKMREEVGDAILQRLAKTPDNRHLQRQMTLINRASICTIHSLCLDIVRTNFHLLDIDPDFSVADAGEAELMKDQAAQEVLAESYEEGAEDFLDLADTYGAQRGDERLQELLLRVHEFAWSMPFPEQWLMQKAEMFDMKEDFDSSIWVETVKESAKLTVDGCIALAEEMCRAVERDGQLECYTDAVTSDLNALTVLRKTLERGWDEIVDALEQFTFVTLRAARGVDPALTEPVKQLRSDIKEEIKTLRAKVFHTHTAPLTEDLRRLAPRMRALGNLVCRFDRQFSLCKGQRGVLDFGDLEHLCLKALSRPDGKGGVAPSEAALSLQEKFEEILVDEYQDSNELQETIFSLISRGDNLFMVGDRKQSIYRFRHTNPMLFQHKQDTYSLESGPNRKVIMSQNFRSRAEIIDAVNFVFRQVASPLVGEMEYGPEERLHAGLRYPPPSEGQTCGGGIEVIVADDETEEEEAPERLTGIEAEALQVARRINELVSEPYYVLDSGEYRPVTYRDVVILMRATAGSAPVFEQVLQSCGIPVFSDTGGGYFMTQEVVTMLSLLETIDNPMQDIPLLAVLRSPIAGFEDEDLLRIRLFGRDGDIYGALCACAEGDGELSARCRAFLEKLKKWRSWALYLPTHQLIWRLYSDTGYYSFAGAMTGGVQRQANLRLLYERARQYEKTSFRGLFHFVGFIGRIRRLNGDMGSAKLLGENQNVVRIMSIHKSKGLEFPVVFVCGLGKRFNLQDMSRNVLLHKELGFGPDYRDTEACFTYPSVAKSAIRQKMKYENLSEELRLLYVAMTRAREKLFLTMSLRKADSRMQKWKAAVRGAKRERLPVHSMAAASGFADWLMSAVLRCKGCAEEDTASLDLPGEFEIRRCHRASPPEPGIRAEELVRDRAALEDTWIARRLDYRYPFAKAEKIPTKISVTELKRIQNFELDADAAVLYDAALIDTPAFLQETRGLSAAQRGSVMHFVMQHLDLTRTLDEREIALQIQQMEERELLDAEQLRTVNQKRICEFFQTELGRRMLASRRVVRETPFEIRIDSGEVYGDGYRGETLLLQGIVDCYFEEDEKLILVDYKTDLVHNNRGGEMELAQRYKLQLDCYARALTQVTGKRVAEKNLYFFSSNCVVKLACDGC